MGLFDAILGATILGKAAYEAKKISDVQNSNDFLETVKLCADGIREYSDYQLMKEFHESYAENSGTGLITKILAQNYMTDPVFKAYLQVFGERRYRKCSIICTYCGATVGVRWAAPENVNYSAFTGDENIIGGTRDSIWSCPDCKKTGHWKYCVNQYGRHYYKASDSLHWGDLG